MPEIPWVPINSLPRPRCGARGPPGDVGPQGPVGPTGQNGPQGVAGPQGPVGPTGPNGPQGVAGPRGMDGLPSNHNAVVQDQNSIVTSTTRTPVLVVPPYTLVGGGSVDQGIFTTAVLAAGTYEVRLSTQYLMSTTVAAPNIIFTVDSNQLFNMQQSRSTSSSNHISYYFSTVLLFPTSATHSLIVEAFVPATYQVTFKRLHISIFRIE